MGFHLDWPQISAWIDQSRLVLIKKLSRNDCSWADDASKHQAGFYVPASVQQSRFFPPLHNSNPDKPHIFDAMFETFWPSSGESRTSALKHYSNKGSEYHCTRVPKEQFSDLAPASLLIGGAMDRPVGTAFHWFMVIDSTSPEAEIIEAAFALDSGFHFGLFAPDELPNFLSDEDQFISELRSALVTNNLSGYLSRQSLPSPSSLALKAQEAWMKDARVRSLDPYELPCPGDAVMSISRDIEFNIYKKAELRQRVSQALDLLTQNEDLIASLVRGFGKLDQLFLSAAQTRKSRAGLSFEHHIQRMLSDGHIRHQAQIPVGGRRPDFVLPNIASLAKPVDPAALILSLKTTLRERWKQVGMERRQAPVFLATVDDRVSNAAIEEMRRNGIVLIVPESLKKSKEAVYAENSSVMTFREFFDQEVKLKRPTLITPMA